MYHKHKDIYVADVDATMKNLGVALKHMYSQRMSALLVDVDAAIQEGDVPSIVFHQQQMASKAQISMYLPRNMMLQRMEKSQWMKEITTAVMMLKKTLTYTLMQWKIIRRSMIAATNQMFHSLQYLLILRLKKATLVS
jgi:hypothetical protein